MELEIAKKYVRWNQLVFHSFFSSEKIKCYDRDRKLPRKIVLYLFPSIIARIIFYHANRTSAQNGLFIEIKDKNFKQFFGGLFVCYTHTERFLHAMLVHIPRAHGGTSVPISVFLSFYMCFAPRLCLHTQKDEWHRKVWFYRWLTRRILDCIMYEFSIPFFSGWMKNLSYFLLLRAAPINHMSNGEFEYQCRVE